MKTQNKTLRAFPKGITLIAALGLSFGSLQAKDYQLTRQDIKWTGSMPAKTHEGQLTLKSFEVDITDEGKVTALTAVVDMTKINVTDLEGGKRDKLTGHLESDDFFHVEKYPTATFVLSEHKGDNFHGTLTIRGVSKKIALPAKVSGHPDRGWILAGDFDYDRNDFGVDYQNSGLLGFMNAAKSKLIDEMIDVSVQVKLEPKG
jgi:polyisoprenoid-binding protein YceI